MPFDINAAKQAGYSDEEIQAYLNKKGGATNFNRESRDTEKRPSFLERQTPAITSFLGGFLGPIGTAAGYSSGHAAQNVAREIRGGGQDVLAELMGRRRAQQLTPYAQQRSQQLGLTGQQSPEMIRQLMQRGGQATTTPDVSYGRQAARQALSGQGAKRAGGFLARNLGGAALSGGLDLALGGYSGPKTLFGKQLPSKVTGVEGLIPKLLNKGLMKARGAFAKPITKNKFINKILPITRGIEESAGVHSDEAWTLVQEGLDKAGDKPVSIAPIIDDLKKAQKELVKGFDIEDLVSKQKASGKDIDLLKKVAGYDEVIDQLNILSDEGTKLTAQQIQTVKSSLGTQSFSQRTGFPRVSTELKEQARLQAMKQGGGRLRELVIEELEKQGVEGAANVYDEWAKLSGLSELAGMGQRKLMTKDIFYPGVLGPPIGAGIGLATGNVGLGVGAPLAGYLVGTPYGRHLLRQMARPALKSIPPAARYGSSALINSLMDSGQQNERR